MRETIAAIASPPGTGAIGIIRVSGNESWKIVGKVLKRALKNIEPRRVYKNTIVDENGEIDEVLLVFYQSPKSYTGEDMVEVFTHGGYVVTRMVLKAILGAGAREAEPGEFTKRAFLNGKLDLSEAEAIRELIEAKVEEEARAFLKNVKGELKKAVEEVRKFLIEILAEVEVELDYPEDFAADVSKIKRKLEVAIDKMKEIAGSAEKSFRASHGIRVVITGKPNVGKSTLLNRLLREDRAIVTPIPGTTRDVIYEDLNIHGHHFKLVDTAGFRKTEDEVEIMGIERTKREIDNADIVIFLVDPTQGWTDEDETLFSLVKDKKVIVAVNKIDVGTMDLPEKLKSYKVVEISALVGKGIKELERTLVEIFKDYFDSLKRDVVVTSERQKELLKSAYVNLQNAYDAFNLGVPTDIASIDIKNALKKLDEITGKSFTEEILDTIFSRFCVGK